MTQQYAVKDNAEFNGRSKFATDYVFVGNGAAAKAEVARVKNRDGNEGVTIYKVTGELEFVEQADLDVRKDAQNFTAGAKEKAFGLAAKWGIPTTKANAKKKAEELKGQALQEAQQTGAQLAAGMMMAVQMGQKDPKQLAKTVQTGLKAKFAEVKTRGKDFVDGVTGDAKALDKEVASDAKTTVSKVVDRVVGPEPMAVRTNEGKTFLRMAFLTTAGNATQIAESTLNRQVKAPGARKTRSPKGPK